MRKNRMLPTLGLALALPLLIASLAFACDGDKTSASTASTAQAGDKAGCAAKCTGAKAATASSASCAGKTASASHCAGKADAAAAGSQCEGKAAQTADAKSAADCAGKSASMITYTVSGMTCMGCVKQVEAAVAKLEMQNVESVSVNLEDHNAVVTTTGPVDAVAVATAISEAGFPAELSNAVPTDDAAKASAAKDSTEEPAATM